MRTGCPWAARGLAALLVGFALQAALAGPAAEALFEVRSVDGQLAVVQWNPAVVQAATAAGRPFVVRSFPLPSAPAKCFDWHRHKDRCRTRVTTAEAGLFMGRAVMKSMGPRGGS